MIFFSLPFVPNSISWWVNNASDKFIIMYYLGEGATGIYSIASRVPSLLILFTVVFNQAWQVVAIKKSDKNSSEYYSEIFLQYGSVLFFICSILIFFSPLLAKILFLNEYYVGWKYVPFLLVAMVAGALANYYDAIIVSTNRTKSIFYATTVAAIINIGLNFLLIPSIGIIGAAVSTMISYLSIFFIKIYTAKRLLINFRIDIRIFLLLIITLVQVFMQLSQESVFNVYSLLLLLAVTLMALKQIIKLFSTLNPFSNGTSKL
jgi:O-antigen/teichoic acid export membrane protein